MIEHRRGSARVVRSMDNAARIFSLTRGLMRRGFSLTRGLMRVDYLENQATKSRVILGHAAKIGHKKEAPIKAPRMLMLWSDYAALRPLRL